MTKQDFHLLSLIYNREVDKLAYFLVDVSNVKRLRRRALRLGGWKLLNPLEKGILNTVVNVLTRVKSKLLLNVITQIIVKIADYLLSNFEKTLLRNYYRLKELLSNGFQSNYNPYLSGLSLDDEYLYNHAWRLTIAEYSGMDCTPLIQ